MAATCVMGIDVGTSGCKVLLLNETGEILCSVMEEYPLYTPQAGWSEQDPEDWWQGVIRAVGRLRGKLEGRTLAGIGLSGQMHGMTALDENFRVVRRAILWNDQRTAAQCAEITAAAGGLQGLLACTNNPMLTGFTGGKILWMKQSEPENYAKTRLILNPKDYIRFRLSGVCCTEVSDASGTGLFDVKNRRWHTGLMETIGLSPALFPPVHESTEITARVSEEAARLLGIQPGVPIAGGGGDAVISTTGLGLAKPGRVGVTLGTSGVAAMGLSGYIDNPRGALQISCGNAPGSYHAMGVTLAAAGSYQWFKDTFGDYEAAAEQAGGKNAFMQLDALAAGTPAGADGLIFLPYLTGERCPVNDPAARGAFLGLTLLHKKGHFARAVLEGVAFSLKQVYDLVRSADPSACADEIVLAGGGAKSPVWRQIFADVFGAPVRTVYGSAEGGSFGAALVAGVSVGFWQTLEAAAGVIRSESETLPNPGTAEIYRVQYDIYTRMYDALKWSFPAR